MSSALFDALVSARNDSPALVASMVEAVGKIGTSEPSRPGMLLGRIQSGKTRAFIGIIARAFDTGFDLAIVLTKGTQALSEQTVRRIEEDFGPAIESDQVRVYDIMRFPTNLRAFQLSQKIVLVAKKEAKNLQRIMDALSKHYPNLKAKRLLIVDDEADFATLNFRKNKTTDAIEAGVIANWIDQLRAAAATAGYLQVTATPYSLYLQPDNEESNPLFHPIRPAFTVLLPVFEGYVGGDYFFGSSEDEGSPAWHSFKEVSPEELDALRKEDNRRFKLADVLTTPRLTALRAALLTFITGGSIRRLQQTAAGLRTEKYAFVVHTDQTKGAHSWQSRVVGELVDRLEKAAVHFPDLLEGLVRTAFDDLAPALAKGQLGCPEFPLVLAEVRRALIEQHLMFSVVNSETEVKNMLDERGQLHLDAPLNVFIGGQILDRGITIRNLIGFYYGRSPRSFQQDTVLQHARLYGNRHVDDLPVTRFYTTVELHGIMRQIHEFDSTLRLDIEKGDGNQGVYFLRKDARGHIKPCSPNKILASAIVSIRPRKRLLPIGFQSGHKTHIKRMVDAIDGIVAQYVPSGITDGEALVPASDAADLLRRVGETLEFEEPYGWDAEGYGAALLYLARQPEDVRFLDRVHLLVRRDRNLSRYREREQRFSNDPLSYQDRPRADALAQTAPVLALVRQNGAASDGWRDTPFWWPIIVPPVYIKPIVFASKTSDED
jgi:hypothetical protein